MPLYSRLPFRISHSEWQSTTLSPITSPEIINVRAMFWHVDSEKMFFVDELVSNADEYAAKVRERKAPASDILLMDQAIEHV